MLRGWLRTRQSAFTTLFRSVSLSTGRPGFWPLASRLLAQGFQQVIAGALIEQLREQQQRGASQDQERSHQNQRHRRGRGSALWPRERNLRNLGIGAGSNYYGPAPRLLLPHQLRLIGALRGVPP